MVQARVDLLVTLLTLPYLLVGKLLTMETMAMIAVAPCLATMSLNWAIKNLKHFLSDRLQRSKLVMTSLTILQPKTLAKNFNPFTNTLIA